MRDIVAQDLQEIPRVLATIRSLMCCVKSTCDASKGHRSEDPCLHTCTCSHHQRYCRKEWDTLGQPFQGGKMGKNCLTSLAFYEALKVACAC